MRLKLIAADKTDTGKQRDQNEDMPFRQIQSTEDGDRGLFIVADGMGGYQAGEVASKIAVERIRDCLHSFFAPVYEQPTIKLQVDEVGDATIKMTPEELGETTVKTESFKSAKSHKTLKFADTPITLSVEKQLIEAIKEANKAIIRHGEQHPAARGLGCTVTTALVQNDKAYIANVGDSRTYLLRSGELKPLTRDHSLVARLVEAKQIEPDEVYSHPQRNLIYRSLGAGHKNIDVDVFHLDLKAGDTLLLCSDGLWEMVRHEDLKKALSAPTSPQKICDNLIDMANANGGEDNITAVVVHVSTM